MIASIPPVLVDLIAQYVALDVMQFEHDEILCGNMSLSDVHFQNEYICMLGVVSCARRLAHERKSMFIGSTHACALQHVKIQTPAMCRVAVLHCGLALEHVRVQTREICLMAVEENGRAMRHVVDMTNEILEAAIADETCTRAYCTRRPLVLRNTMMMQCQRCITFSRSRNRAHVRARSAG